MKPGLPAFFLIVAALLGACLTSPQTRADERLATFAGGCFWCMEPPFDKIEGVISTTSGYAGGDKANPSYEEVSAGTTGHAEVVQVRFDNSKVSYSQLLEVFWINVDPLDDGGQFCDRGSQYRSAIFYHDEKQRELAEASKQGFAEKKLSPGAAMKEIVTEIAPLEAFYPAEEYHQNYYQKNPLRYRFYRARCGRDGRLEEVWGDGAGG